MAAEHRLDSIAYLTELREGIQSSEAGYSGSVSPDPPISLRGCSGNEELALAKPLTSAIMSFCRGDYDGAVESISAIRAAADRCGGSVAQCDLIHLTLLEAALRGHRKPLARMLAAERAVRKPASRLNRWLKARAWTLGTARLAT